MSTAWPHSDSGERERERSTRSFAIVGSVQLVRFHFGEQRQTSGSLDVVELIGKAEQLVQLVHLRGDCASASTSSTVSD